jgi:hypothetical protein
VLLPPVSCSVFRRKVNFPPDKSSQTPSVELASTFTGPRNLCPLRFPNCVVGTTCRS